MAHQQDADTSLKLELEQEEKRHKEAVATLTAKYNKRKADDISKDKDKIDTTSKVSEEIADGTTTTQNLKEEKKFKYEFDCADYACGECDKHPKDEADSDDNFKSCATCAKSVCKDCVVTCEECGENYCKCVHEDDSKEFCEDCEERASRFICCHYSVTMVPCGRTVCDKCKDMHRGSECNHCYQAISGGWAKAVWD